MCVTGAVCAGGGQKVSAVRSYAFSDQSDLSSKQIKSSAFIGVDVAVTDATGVGVDLFKIGDGGEVSSVFPSSGFGGFFT